MIRNDNSFSLNLFVFFFRELDSCHQIVVKFRRLKTEHWNGKLGTIKGYSHQRDRFAVECHLDQRVRFFKEKNLTAQSTTSNFCKVRIH